MFQRFLLRLYRKIARYDRWRHTHFSFIGHLVLFIMMTASVFGIDTQQTSTYQMPVFLLSLLILAFIHSRFIYLNLSIKRQLPRYGTVGETLIYHVLIHNLTEKTYDKLTLFERLKSLPPTHEQLKKFYQLDQQPFFKRLISFKQWQTFFMYQRGGVLENIPLPLLAQKPLSIKVTFTPIRRGQLTFAASQLAVMDILGLYQRLISFRNPENLLILPQRYPIRALNLLGHDPNQLDGFSLANAAGDSTEFMALREYQQGDALKRIHWKSYAKQEKLIVKDYQDDYFVRRALVLDTFMGNKPRLQFEAAISVAASLAMNKTQQDSLIDLMFVGEKSYCFTTGRSVDHLPRLQEILALVPTSDEIAFEKLHVSILSHAPTCHSFICVFMHWDHPRQTLVKQLLAQNISVAVFLLHGGELTLEECSDRPQHFYLLNHQYLAAELAVI